MAIYHLEAKIVSRGTGRSAVAAAAYMSCSKILNDYDGVLHDFTRKRGLIWAQTFLPENAPAEWADRAVLWNAVEENEKTKDSRLAREFVVALPIEMDKEKWIELLTEFIQTQFVSNGMCADAAIHDTDGHNPHAHILLTVRPLNPDGTWQYKTQKEYLCVRGKEERGLTAEEFKTAQAEGWEKQYQYRVGGKKVYLPPSRAEGLERLSKTPRSTRFGRQNPISARWNSDEQLVLWREAWADTVNRHLERLGADARIDHRSHAARGLPELPTVHEGVTARTMERKGYTADRCELNRRIKADNAFLQELRRQMEHIAKAVLDTIPAIARALEALRQKLLMLQYQVLHYRSEAWQVADDLRDVKPDLTRFDTITAEIKTKTAQQRSLTNEKKQTPAWSLLKKRELTQRINALTEELEDLRTEKNRILASFDLTDDKEMADIRRWTKQQEVAIQTLNAQQDRCEQELNYALEEYEALSTHAASFDPDTLWPERLKERENLTNEARTALLTRFGADYSEKRLNFAEQQVRELLPQEERGLQLYWKEKWQTERENRKSQDRNRSKDTGR